MRGTWDAQDGCLKDREGQDLVGWTIADVISVLQDLARAYGEEQVVYLGGADGQIRPLRQVMEDLVDEDDSGGRGIVLA